MLERQLSQGSTLLAVFVSALGLALIAFVDIVTGNELSLSLFYLGPIALFAWRTGVAGGVVASIVGAATWYSADVLGGHVYAHPLIPMWNAMVRLGFFVIVCVLLLSLRRAVERETALARTDLLTGLLNRRAFEELAEREIERAARTGNPVTFAYIDLDGFKQINDRLGHAAGDDVLRSVARTMNLVLRHIDVKARLGGDEFGLVMPDTSTEAAGHAVERLSAALSAAGIACSIGSAIFENPPVTVAEALETVDAVMYDVKADPTRTAAVRVIPRPLEEAVAS